MCVYYNGDIFFLFIDFINNSVLFIVFKCLLRNIFVRLYKRLIMKIFFLGLFLFLSFVGFFIRVEEGFVCLKIEIFSCVSFLEGFMFGIVIVFY